MFDEKNVELIIMNSLSAINDELDDVDKIDFNADSLLFGVNCPLDSLSLVSLIVDIEAELNAQLDEPISLMDDRAVMREKSPFESVPNLKEYIMELLNERN